MSSHDLRPLAKGICGIEYIEYEYMYHAVLHLSVSTDSFYLQRNTISHP